MALCDYLTRHFSDVVSNAGAHVRKQSGGGWGAAKGGEMTIDVPGQKVGFIWVTCRFQPEFKVLIASLYFPGLLAQVIRHS